MSDLLECLDIKARALAVDAITAAIETSFRERPCRQTQAEIKARFDHCLGFIRVMRNDLGWSWQRITDTLPEALRAKLDGVDWTPSSRSSWSSDPSTGLLLPPSAK